MVHLRNTPGSETDLQWTWGISLVLGLVTLLVYWGVFTSQFVYFDDPYYVFDNPHIQAGLTWSNITWAFTTRDCQNWHPLTWLSLLLDDNIYGLDPTGFHATNLFFHICNSVLLFLLLQYLTGARWQSALVGALFALHPLHVESVAWVTERKDVLSTLLWLLTIWAYAKHVTSSKWQMTRTGSLLSRVTCHLSPFYFLALFFFALGLMAKPMLVTMPFLLLLLDFWPLKRLPPVLKIFGREFRIADSEGQTPFGRSSWSRLVMEKVPLLALSVISCAVTLWAQTQSFVLAIPFEERLENAAVSYLRYMVKMVWPHRLYINYPYPGSWPVSYRLLAVTIMGCFSVIAVWKARRWPYVFTGWFWFVGTLVPVIGLAQVGFQSLADRYTYFPLVGLFIVVAWLGYELSQKWQLSAVLIRTVAILALTACIPLTIIQVGYWKSSLTLFQHALRLNPNNFEVEFNLASAYVAEGQPEPAINHLERAAKLNPAYGETYSRIGKNQLWLGRFQDAEESFQAALQHHAPAAEARLGLAIAFQQQGKWDLAAEQAKAALALDPQNPLCIQEYNQIQKEMEKKQVTTGHYGQ